MNDSKGLGPTRRMHQRTALQVLGIARPQRLPASVVYSIDGGLIPETVDRPDKARPKWTRLDSAALAKTAPKRVNGLTYKADAMARWMAHGATASDAFRAAYKPHPNMTDARISHHAWVIQNRPAFSQSLEQYREECEEEGQQTSFEMRDFVKARLVLEAQQAKQDSARIQALKLLGQTEGMFTTVHRNEKAINPADLESLKAKLDQRLRETLARLGQGIVPTLGTQHGVEPEEGTGGTGPHPPGNPLIASGSPLEKIHTIPPTSSPVFGGGLSSPMPEETGRGVVSPENPAGVASPSGDVAAGYLSELDPESTGGR